MSLFELLFALIHIFIAISFAKFVYLFYGFVGSLFAFIFALGIVYYLGMVVIAGMFDYIDSISPKVKKRDKQLENLVIYAFVLLVLISIIIGFIYHYAFVGYLFFVEIILIVGFLKILWLKYQYKKSEVIFEHLKKEAKDKLVKHVIDYPYECRIDEVLLILGESIDIKDIAKTEYLLDLLFEKNLIKEEVYHEIIGSCAVRRLKDFGAKPPHTLP